MCGIAGIYNLDNIPIDIHKLYEMTNIVRHRGPDDEGYLLVNTQSGVLDHYHGDDTIVTIKRQTPHLDQSQPANLGFGFRRLSIIDLTPTGHQPMCNSAGSLWIVYNGEIYNYLELRDELTNLGYQFRSNSDTEVILAAYEEWGAKCLVRFNGMWSFALWDNRQKRLFCARDRFGVKPFAYYFDKKRFIFGSEIKQILLHNIDKTLNMSMIYRSMKLNSFLCYGDETYFQYISVLPHAHYLQIENGHLEIKKYYELDPQSFETSNLSVHLRMRSDVEVGSALSGGLDSSAIVCTAAQDTPQRFKTFTAYYTEEERYDERRWVELVGQRTDSELHFVSPQPDDVMANFEKMTYHNDYPIIGSSFISQHYVMRLARQNNVPVLLDGQGSDEILGGYNHSYYRYYADLLNNLHWLKFLKEYPPYLIRNQKGSVGAKMAKTLLSLLFRESTLYRQEARLLMKNPLALKIDNYQLFQHIIDLPVSRLSNFLYNLLMTTSIQTLLHFEDRNSMTYSIESRVPFLDYRLVEFVFSLPSEYKISGATAKLVHRQALTNIVPPEIINRQDKVNFAAPGESHWMRHRMQGIFNQFIHSPEWLNNSIFNHKLIEEMYKSFQLGNERYSALIWRVFAFQKWYHMFVSGTCS
jgi:asparagine synthase (glutamine-hydrolysing)